MQHAHHSTANKVMTRTSTPMYEGEAPTPAFTPKEHVVEVRPEVQQAGATASPQVTYPRAEKHGTGNHLYYIKACLNGSRLLLLLYTSLKLVCILLTNLSTYFFRNSIKKNI